MYGFINKSFLIFLLKNEKFNKPPASNKPPPPLLITGTAEEGARGHVLPNIYKIIKNY